MVDVWVLQQRTFMSTSLNLLFSFQVCFTRSTDSTGSATELKRSWGHSSKYIRTRIGDERPVNTSKNSTNHCILNIELVRKYGSCQHTIACTAIHNYKIITIYPPPTKTHLSSNIECDFSVSVIGKSSAGSHFRFLLFIVCTK